MKNCILIILVLLSFQYIQAQTQISNFSSLQGEQSANPTDFVEFNDLFFYEASTISNGREIWVSSGKPDEAYLLKDIYPGINNSVNYTFKNTAAILNNTLYFVASDGLSDGEIWKTDGTPPGTVKLTSFLNSKVLKLTVAGDLIYFLIQSGNLLQVWKCDGTASGTEMVLNDIPVWNSPSYQGKCNDIFIFTFQPSGSNNSRVWRSDGSATGTFPITVEIDGIGAAPGGTSGLTQYIEFNNELYFVARSYNAYGFAGVGILKTDGTLENTVPVKHLANGDLVEYADVIEINNKLYFSFFTVDEKSLTIWECDGTESGTKIIFEEYGSRYYMTSNLAKNQNSLIFCGANQTGGTSLIELNLENLSKNTIKELADTTEIPFIFTSDRNICNIQQISDGKFFISSPFEKYDRKGWVSTLTEATTINLTDMNNIYPGVFSFNNSIYFAKNTDSIGSELCMLDAEDKIKLIANTNKGRFGLVNSGLSVLNNNLIFDANDGVMGQELWIYNSLGLKLLKEINQGKYGSNPYGYIPFNNQVYFFAFYLQRDYDLWKTNGTTEGTSIAYDINDGLFASSPVFLTLFKNELYFIASKNGHNNLFKTNGNDLQLIHDLGVNEYGSPYSATGMVSTDNYLYFSTEGAGDDLWKSDGTQNGTTKIINLSYCRNLIAVNGRLFFTSYSASGGGNELFTSDGSEQGTILVKNIGEGYSSNPGDFFSFKNLLFFSAYTIENGREIWQSNGTEAGTFILKDIYPGSQSSVIKLKYTILGDELLFNANDGYNGMELWKTNGSESGTSMVKNINPGSESSFPTNMVTINDLVYFKAYDSEHGEELWKTDGTEEGTILVSDIISGITGSAPEKFVFFDDRVFFVAETPNDGRQIYSIKYNSLQGIALNQQDELVLVSPNPCDEYINLITKYKVDEIIIFNNYGELVLTETPEGHSINTSNLAPGLYLMKCKINEQAVVRKFIKR